ncbi:hypothetical protein [Clostridium ihumii]|uniref:hypothetical protein n=1 Tax=Clostridium ihumii TaxID=1470356 RepID=UPI0005916443|nr:hypothetical protein [Clostridium ihumii]
MEKNKLVKCTRFLYSTFLILTIIMLFMVYKDFSGKMGLTLGMIYVFFTFFIILYTIIIIVVNFKKSKDKNIVKRLTRFIMIFLLVGIFNYILDKIFTPSDINLVKNFSIALGLAIGVSFFDVILLKNKEN